MIIAFSGKRGVGKTTAADVLVREYGFTKLSFAGKLKDVAKTFFAFSDSQLFREEKETKFKNYDWTPREFLAGLGEFIRFWDEDYWITVVLNQLKKNPGADWTIDDVRYLNEAAQLKNLSAKLVRIERYSSHNPYKESFEHPSETGLDSYKNWDYTVQEYQNENLATLRHTVRMLYEKFLS